MVWYTAAQLEQRAKDLKEIDWTMTEAVGDINPGPHWDGLSEDRKEYWRAKARAHLDAITPMDLTRPLRTRDGMFITNARFSADGMSILATAEGNGAKFDASWPVNGLYCEGREGEDRSDLLYADASAASDRTAEG